MGSDKEDAKEKKPVVTEPKKTSMQILSELFSTFDAEPPVIVKKEKKGKNDESPTKKSKKSKKKHKHKDKKHKKKSKKKKISKSSSSSSSSSDDDDDDSAIDLAKILIKQEKDNAEKKIKIAGTDLALGISSIIKTEKSHVKSEKNPDNKKTTTTEENDVNNKSKIVIKDLKYSSVFESTLADIKMKVDKEETDTKKHSSKKHKHRSSTEDKVSKRSRSKSKDRSEKKIKIEDLRDKIKSEHHKHKHSSHDRIRHRSRDRDFYREDHRSSRHVKERDRDRKYHNSSSKEEHSSSRHSSKSYYSTDTHKEKDEFTRSLEDYKRSRHKDNSFYKDKEKEKDDDFYRSRSREPRDKDDKWFMRERYRGHNGRERSRSRENSSSRIDKKKLLEIARKNAINMMKSGSLPGAMQLGPQAQEKVIAAIKSGGKTVEELTDFCKSLSKKEELGELSSMSEKDDSDTDEPFHHPFQIKDRPTSITMNIKNSDSLKSAPFHHPFQIKDRPTSIVMNIKNSVPLPIKSTVERNSELRIQFPVSSGQQHRKNEDWVPVPPPSADKKQEEAAKAVAAAVEKIPPPAGAMGPSLAIEAPPEPPEALIAAAAAEVAVSEPAVVAAPPNAPPGPQVFPTPALESSADIGSIVSQRLTAMRKLQENPNDVQALTQIYKSNKEMQTWAQSKQQLGQFTGSTGVQILSQAELASGYQAWAKKDQLQCAAPVSGGMGMHLLQKMGWKPGEGLGKEKTGALEPLLLEVKLDKRGLVATEEQPRHGKKGKGKPQQPTVKTLQGKHPVSLLGEYASKRKLGAPQYVLEFECGPDHKKNFLFKVTLNGIEYKPNVASQNKKEAKAHAATVALQQIGLLP